MHLILIFVNPYDELHQRIALAKASMPLTKSATAARAAGGCQSPRSFTVYAVDENPTSPVVSFLDGSL
jgi:hypothetical protein